MAGVSIDYYIRLEQAKETNPSTAILDALARALRLNAEEAAHLYALADHAAGRVPPQPPQPPPQLRAGIVQLLETVRPFPAYVLSRTSDVLAANPEGLALFAGITDWPQHRRNTMRYIFTHPSAKTLFTDWDDAATSGAAQLRSLLAVDPRAEDLTALADELASASPEFARLWEHYDVKPRRGGTKQFQHPLVGDLSLTYEALYLGIDRQRMTIYQATPGTPDHDALTLLSLIATAAEEGSVR